MTDRFSRRDMVKAAGVAAAGAAAAGAMPARAQSAQTPQSWDREADVVVIGSGATGLPAAIVAREKGNDVLVLEAQPHVGGHAICSGGFLPLGGGTHYQKAAGINDSPDLVFADLTDWSIVQGNGAADYRFNDREVIRAFADHCTATFNFLEAHGVKFTNTVPDNVAGSSWGNSVPRLMHIAVMDWPRVQTGMPAPADQQKTMHSGNGLMQPLHKAATDAGVTILTGHRMTQLIREAPASGRVLGVQVEYNGTMLHIRAKKAVIVGTGGSTGNVNFRRMFDPRLTEEYCGLAGMPWSDQDASGELAGLAVGAGLWGFANQVGEFGSHLTKAGRIGTQYGYRNLEWLPGSPVFDKARATGLHVADWQNVILVNMVGKRFYDETARDFTANRYGEVEPYTHGDWRNSADAKWQPRNFIDAALAGIGDGHNGGGPIWAIFDADAGLREKWHLAPPDVDPHGFFFQAETIADLARAIKMQYQRVPMPPEALEATVARYNSFVDSGTDADFAKPAPKYKIAKGPFYAAWSTPVIHDTRAGLRINGRCQVVDMQGAVIPGLYAGGECAGGFSMHGLARATCQGFIAGNNAAAEKAAV